MNEEQETSQPWRLTDVLDQDAKEYLTRTKMIVNVLWGTAALFLFMAILILFCVAFAPVAQ
jgi:hypothetical protein